MAMQTPTFLPLLVGYQQVVPLILRVVLGVTLVYFGYKKIEGAGQSSGSNSRVYGITEVVVGLFLVIGLFTQLAALINAFILVIKLAVKIKEGKFLSDGINYYILLLAIAISLLFLTSGALSVDRLF